MSSQGTILRLCSQMASHRTFLLGRSVNLQQTAGLKRAALEKLGIPQKPMRPLSPYFRFLAQVRPNLTKAHPNLKLSELSKVAGVEWLKLTAQQKQQYEIPYKKDLVGYTQAMNEFKTSLTDEHRMKIKEAQLELKEDKIKKGLKLKMKELGKPKRFLSAFMIYLQEKQAKRGNIAPVEWQKKMSESWKKLSPSEKAKFDEQSLQLRNDYFDSLKKWEDKMIRLGNLALVRSSVLKDKQAKALANARETTAADVKVKSSGRK